MNFKPNEEFEQWDNCSSDSGKGGSLESPLPEKGTINGDPNWDISKRTIVRYRPAPVDAGVAHGEYCLPVCGGFYEITMNLPRTQKFLMSNADNQKLMYAKRFQELKAVFTAVRPDAIFASEYVFEYCKSGMIHLHGYISVNPEMKIFPIGGLVDIVKQYLNTLPKAHGYNKFYSSALSSMFCRYEGTGICVTYRYDDEVENIERWKTYMKKQQ